MSLDERREVAAQAGLHRAERLREAGLPRPGEPHVPQRELAKQVDPLAPSERSRAARLELAEPRDEFAREMLLPDPVALEQARHHREHLARLHRFDEIIVDSEADRLAHRGGVLRFRHHHDGHGGVQLADQAEQVEAAAARHLLVHQHHAIGAAPEQLERVVAVRGRGDLVAVVGQEAAMRLEPLGLVVHPQDALGPRRHCGNLAARGRARYIRPTTTSARR